MCDNGTSHDTCQTDCTNTDTLRATGSVTLARTYGNQSWSERVAVCEGIFLCSNPTSACVRCSEYTLSGSATPHTEILPEFVCEDAPDGQWQYMIWAVVLDTTECPSECDQGDQHACDPDSDCNACYNKEFALAGSCCITIQP